MVARLRVVQPHAVHEDEHLAEVGAAQREIALHAEHATGAHVHGRDQPQHVGDGVRGQGVDLLASDDGHRPRDAAEIDGAGGGGHDDGLAIGLLRGDGRGGEQHAQGAEANTSREHISLVYAGGQGGLKTALYVRFNDVAVGLQTDRLTGPPRYVAARPRRGRPPALPVCGPATDR